MELFFNELSIKKRDSINPESIVMVAKVYKELLKYGVTTCRIAPDDYNRLLKMVSNGPDSINVRNFYFSFFRTPYESEEVEECQDVYLEHNWTYEEERCFGFALAFLLGTAGFSLYSPEWDIPFISLFKDLDPNNVRNICIKEHVGLHIPQIQKKNEIELLICNLQASEKKIVLRNDHGIDVLEGFSKRLVRCPYLVGIINSLPFNPYERKFIKKIREDGLIEIVLPCTDKGYGIVVKTTGRTIYETKKIAEILEEEFGYI